MIPLAMEENIHRKHCWEDKMHFDFVGGKLMRKADLMIRFCRWSCFTFSKWRLSECKIIVIHFAGCRFKTPARLLLLTNERVSQRFVFKCLFCAYSNGWDRGQRRHSSSKFGGGDGCRRPQLLWEDLHHWSVKTDVRFLLINSLQAESRTISPICYSEWTGTRWRRTGVHTSLAL